MSTGGLLIICVLLYRAMHGQLSISDVAVRGLVIVIVISVADRVIVPLLSMGVRTIGTREDAAEAVDG